MRRSDPGLDRLRAVEDYPLVDGEGRTRHLPRPAPDPAVERAGVRAAQPDVPVPGSGADQRPLRPRRWPRCRCPSIYEQLDDIDAGTFLTDINFPVAARHLAFEVFARSFFARPERLSAAELAAMFHIYFLGSSEGLVFDVAESNFDTALWNPLREYLIERGVQFHTGVSAESISPGGAKVLQVRATDGTTIDADGVVLATDVGGLQQIVAASPGLGDDDWRARVAAMRTAPPFVVQRLWLDRPVDAGRPAFLGTGGLEPVDNISVVSNYERQAAEWARAHGGSVVEVHSYSVVDPPPFEGLRERMLAPAAPALPGDRARPDIVAERILLKRRLPAVLARLLRRAGPRSTPRCPV